MQGKRHQSPHDKSTHTPEQKVLAERKNRILMEMAKALLKDSQLPTRFWGDAILHAAYLRNHSPTNSNGGKRTPFEILTGKNQTWADSSHLEVSVSITSANQNALSLPTSPLSAISLVTLITATKSLKLLTLRENFHIPLSFRTDNCVRTCFIRIWGKGCVHELILRCL